MLRTNGLSNHPLRMPIASFYLLDRDVYSSAEMLEAYIGTTLDDFEKVVTFYAAGRHQMFSL